MPHRKRTRHRLGGHHLFDGAGTRRTTALAFTYAGALSEWPVPAEDGRAARGWSRQMRPAPVARLTTLPTPAGARSRRRSALDWRQRHRQPCPADVAAVPERSVGQRFVRRFTVCMSASVLLPSSIPVLWTLSILFEFMFAYFSANRCSRTSGFKLLVLIFFCCFSARIYDSS